MSVLSEKTKREGKKGFEKFLEIYASKTKISEEKARENTVFFIEALKETLVNKDINIISLTGLGNFISYDRGETRGRDFLTGEIVTYPKRKNFKFNFLRTTKENLIRIKEN